MEFLKKNCARIIISCLLIVAGIVYIIALCQISGKFEMFKGHAILIAGIIFFFGMAAYLICRMFSETWPRWILLGVGIACTVFAGAYFIYTAMGDGWKAVKGLKISWFEYLALTHAFTFLVIFGLIPLINSLKKILCPDDAAGPVKKVASAPKASTK